MPRLVDREERQADFVAAIWRLLAREGLTAATLRRVAAEAGCTTGALTHYFADRDALLLAALRAAHDQAAGRMLRAARAATDPPSRLHAILREALPLDAPRQEEWRVWLSFWAATLQSPALAAENRRRTAQWRDALETALSACGLGGATLVAAVSELMALIDGFGVRLAVQADPAQPAATRAQAAAAEAAVLARCAQLLPHH